MFSLDEDFLQSIGLGSMPSDQKTPFLIHVREELELRVGTRLSEGLNNDQLKEFESFMDGKEDIIRQWLQANLPAYEQSDDFVQFKQTTPPDTPELAMLAEYASLKWLEINRPDYKKVVSEEMDRLKGEIIANREMILGNAA